MERAGEPHAARAPRWRAPLARAHLRTPSWARRRRWRTRPSPRSRRPRRACARGILRWRARAAPRRRASRRPHPRAPRPRPAHVRALVGGRARPRMHEEALARSSPRTSASSTSRSRCRRQRRARVGAAAASGRHHAAARRSLRRTRRRPHRRRPTTTPLEPCRRCHAQADAARRARLHGVLKSSHRGARRAVILGKQLYRLALVQRDTLGHRPAAGSVPDTWGEQAASDAT